MTAADGRLPTRADVAKLAGVSPALVSYVLNDGPRKVSPEARARIEYAIRELGYRPNVSARALGGGKSRSIGLLTPSPINSFLAELAEALEGYLFERGNILMIGITRNEPARERRYIEAFLDRKVDGFFLISGRSVDNVQSISKASVPAIALEELPGDASHLDGISWVHVDNFKGGYEATEHLLSHGHKTIGCIAGTQKSALSIARTAGWKQALLDAGLTPDSNLVEHDEFTETSGFDAALRLLTRSGKQRPTAVFVSADIQAIGVLHACAHLGLRVPEDLAIVSFDGSKTTLLERPSVTSIRQPINKIAKAAVDHLLTSVNAPETPAMHLQIPGRIRIGNSCGCQMPPFPAAPLD